MQRSQPQCDRDALATVARLVGSSWATLLRPGPRCDDPLSGRPGQTEQCRIQPGLGEWVREAGGAGGGATVPAVTV